MEYYKNCSELPLKIFFEIANDVENNLHLLVIKGEFDKAKMLEVWESIVLEYSKLDNNQAISDVLETKEEMFRQSALYCEIKGMLLYLAGAYKQEYIERLNELGYKIDKDKIIESLKANDSRSNHIATRMMFLQKDLEKYSEGGNKSSFDREMSYLGTQLGFEPKEDLTVARYIEYKKRIREKINERNKATRHR